MNHNSWIPGQKYQLKTSLHDFLAILVRYNHAAQKFLHSDLNVSFHQVTTELYIKFLQ